MRGQYQGVSPPVSPIVLARPKSYNKGNPKGWNSLPGAAEASGGWKRGGVSDDGLYEAPKQVLELVAARRWPEAPVLLGWLSYELSIAWLRGTADAAAGSLHCIRWWGRGV